MNRLNSILILSFWVLWPLSPSRAQLYPPNEAGATLGAVHTIVRDVEATKKFWALFGGTPMKIDGIDVIQLPGVLVFMHPGEPSGPSRGAVVDHFGINCPNCYDLLKRLVAAGVKTNPINPETMRSPNWKPGDQQRTWNFVHNADGLTVEIETNPCMFGSSHPTLEPCPERIVEAGQKEDPSAPIGSDLLHIYLKDNSEVKGFYNFYTAYFGGKIVRSANINAIIPGVKLNIDKSAQGPRPSNKGRALDSIGFEVKNLEGFCKKLEAAGVKFDQPYSKTRYRSFAHAAFTDPWGTAVQLTEGLNRYQSKAAPPVAQPATVTSAGGAAHGKEIFYIHCSYCHDAASNQARRDVPGLKDLFKWPAHHLADRTEHGEHSVEMIRKLLMEGTSRMDARGVIFSDQEMDDLMVYLQSL